MDACVTVLRQVHAQDGYPLMWPASPAGWISPSRQGAAWVADERGHGIGGLLLSTALRAARARSARAALEVVSLNRHAVALYRAQGWREIGAVSYDWLPEGAQSLLFVPPSS